MNGTNPEHTPAPDSAATESPTQPVFGDSTSPASDDTNPPAENVANRQIASPKPETTHESPADIKLTMLEGMKIIFDEKVGLTPVQVVKTTNGEMSRVRH